MAVADSSSALVEDLFREFATGGKRFDPEELVPPEQTAGSHRHKKDKKRSRHDSSSRKKAKKKRRQRSRERSPSLDVGGMRMDGVGMGRAERRRPPTPTRPASPVFHRTDIVKDAHDRIAKGFDDRVGEDQAINVKLDPKVDIKATSLSEYLRKKGHDVPDTVAKLEEDEENKSKTGDEDKDAKSSETVAAIDNLVGPDKESFPLSKSGADRAKPKPVPVKSSKDLLPRKLKMLTAKKVSDYEGPEPPIRKAKAEAAADDEGDEGEDMVGKAAPLLDKEKKKIAFSVALKSVPGPSRASATPHRPHKAGEEGELAESDDGAQSSDQHDLVDLDSDGEIKEDEDVPKIVLPKKQTQKKQRKKSRSRSRSSSRDTIDRLRSASKRKSSRKQERDRKSSRRSDSHRKKSRRRSRSRERRTKKEEWSWGSGESRTKRRRGPAGFDRNRRPSRTPSRSRSRSADSADRTIDKKKLFEIARRNASAMLSVGTLQQIRNLSHSEITALKAGGKSVDELVEYCKTIQRKDKKKKDGDEDASTDSEATKPGEGELDFTIHHPYALAQKAGIVLNIPNATPLPVNQMTTAQRAYRESQLRTDFPVSSGKQHAITSSEWTPVEKDLGPKAIAAPAEKRAIMPPPPVPLQQPDLSNLPLPPPPTPPMEPVFVPPPGGISAIVTQRLEAQKRLNVNPNDECALQALRSCEDQMKSWAESKNLPGAFIGSTGVQCLRPDELAPRDKRFQAWATRDQLRNARQVDSGVGLNLLKKMGWNPGEGLGKFSGGTVEPLTLDVKFDRRGLVAMEEEARIVTRPKPSGGGAPMDMRGKQPVSALMELCAKRRWDPPSFDCSESGSFHNRRFLWKVRVNGVTYQPATPSTTKKPGKAIAAQIALQSLGLIPRDPSLPVVIA